MNIVNMIPQIAIELAKQNGWEPHRQYNESSWADVMTKPDFWQALGKALGWTPPGGTGRSYHDEYGEGGYPSMYDWQIRAHRFYDLILTGGDTEAFWEELLK